MIDNVKILASKKEAVYATDAAPTLAENAILTRNFSAKPIEADRLDRNLDGRGFGATASAPSNERQTISYETEIAGAGAAGTAPAWMELLEGCGMAAPVLTAGVDAVQRMAAAGSVMSSLTQHHWIDDQLRKMVGSRGTFSIDMTANAYAFLAFSFTGIIPDLDPFTVAAAGEATIDRWKDPVEVNNVNTMLTLDAFALVTRSLRIDANVPVTMRNLVGARYVRRGNHNATGRLSVEAPSVGAKDLYAIMRSGARVPLLATHGTVAGNIVEVSAPKIQITDITERDEDGLLMWDMDLLLTIEDGQDDLVLTAR